MTTKEFDEKYQDYLEDGFDGMEFENEEIIGLCDTYFQKWINYPGFKYAQIKSKFGTSRVYCEGVSAQETHELENEIDKILKNNE
jgi:hypothetical protein